MRLGILCLTLAVTAATVAAMATAATLHTSEPYVALTQNTCRSEFVVLEGTIETVSKVQTSRQGTEHSFEHARISATGFALTDPDVQYVEQTVTNETANVALGPGPSEFTLTQTRHLTRVGEDGLETGDDLRVHIIAHGTFNANGVPTVDKMETSTTCR